MWESNDLLLDFSGLLRPVTMFERLQKKWKVNGLQLLLILCTFAIGGSLTGYVGRLILNQLPLEKGAGWIALYIIVVTVLWPFSVLLVSIFFGQYRFFTGYLRKMGTRMRLIRPTEPVPGKRPEPQHNTPVRIAVFASGAGSNAARIIEHFRNHARISISLIVSNKPQAGVIQVAVQNGVPVLHIEKEEFFRGSGYLPELRAAGIHFIVLAGFLWKIPDVLISAYTGKIVNIHPALLPKHGGKGMYGANVHRAVLEAGDTESGITIHQVDGKYDNGAVIFQATCPVLSSDTADALAQRIHELEHRHYPRVIEELVLRQ